MSVPLMFETAESDLMLQKPRNLRTETLVDWKFFAQIFLFMGLFIWMASFGMFFFYWRTMGFGFYDLILVYDDWKDGYMGHSLDELNSMLAISQSIFYITMTIMQLGNVLAVKNRQMSILESNPFYGSRMNRALVMCMLLHVLVAVANVYLSTAAGLPNIFKFGYVPAMYWFLPIPLALALLAVDEVRKAIIRAYPKSFVANAAW
jgi:sodium/potassium-transporting ATPase subunit alpha